MVIINEMIEVMMKFNILLLSKYLCIKVANVRHIVPIAIFFNMILNVKYLILYKGTSCLSNINLANNPILVTVIVGNMAIYGLYPIFRIIYVNGNSHNIMIHIVI